MKKSMIKLLALIITLTAIGFVVGCNKQPDTDTQDATERFEWSGSSAPFFFTNFISSFRQRARLKLANANRNPAMLTAISMS